MSFRCMSACVPTFVVLSLLVGVVAGQGVPEILYYKLDEGAGSSTANVAQPGSGSSNPSITGHQLSPTGGQFGGCLVGVSNGSGSNNIATGWSTNLGSGSWTIGFWIDLNGVTGNNPTELMYVFGDPTAGSFRCFINSSAGAGNVRMRGPLTELTSVGAPLLNGGHYVHWVYTNTTSTLSLYIDGNLNGTQGQTGLSITGSGFQVGGYTGGGSPQSLRNGVELDEFRVYNRALSGSEIQQTWNTSLTPTGLFADFTATPTSGSSPLVVNFSDASTTTAPGGVNSWMWDFGDGNSSTDQNPTHTYAFPGTYTVTLVANDGVNPPATRIKTDYITSGGYLFDIQTSGGGVGDIVITAAPPPPGTTQGYTFFSTTPASTIGGGNFFGIMFDDFVVQSLNSPAIPGNPFHWVPSPGLYPSVPFALPAGSLTQYSGVTADGVIIYLVGNQIVVSEVDRATF